MRSSCTVRDVNIAAFFCRHRTRPCLLGSCKHRAKVRDATGLRETRHPCPPNPTRRPSRITSTSAPATCNIFVAVEPRGRRRLARVTARRTKLDFVSFVPVFATIVQDHLVRAVVAITEVVAGLLLFAHHDWSAVPVAALISLVGWMLVIEGSRKLLLPDQWFGRFIGYFNTSS